MASEYADDSFAVKLMKLYEIFDAKDEAVAAGIFEKTGVSITASYLNALRRGKRTNPRAQTVHAICSYFDIDPVYFDNGDSARSVSSQINLVHSMRGAGVVDIAARRIIEDLSPEQLNEIANIIEEVRDLRNKEVPGER